MIDASNKELLAVAPLIDLIDYLDAPTMPHNSLFLKVLGKYATELEKDFF